jgi:hypothetical protein
MNQKSISCYSAAARRKCTRLLHINRLFFTAFIMIASAVTFFSCNHSPGATGTVTITVKGDQGVTVNDPKPIPVSKGTKWADLKNRVKVTVKPDYEFVGWKLGSATGIVITDTTVFTSNTTIFAVSKKKQSDTPGDKDQKPGDKGQSSDPQNPEQPKQPGQPPQSEITITIMVDERLETKNGKTEKVKSGKWASVKEKVAAHVQLKSAWSQDDYEIYEWRKGSEDGAPLTDDDVLSGDTTVYVVSNFRKFEIKGGKLIKLLDNEKIKGTVYIPSTVTEIGNEVFNGRENLRKVIIGDSVTTLGENVFALCNHLETVVLSKNLTQLNTGMFEECSALTAITIPSKVISIAERVFEGCTAATVTLPESITEIRQTAFGGNGSFCKQVQIKDGAHFDRIKGLVTQNPVGYPEDRIKKY